VPLYEYQCVPEHHRFEVRQGINDDPVRTCPECGGEVRRVIHPVGIVFKGTGFYATDSKKTPASTKPAETKPESKPAAKESKPESTSGAAAGS